VDECDRQSIRESDLLDAVQRACDAIAAQLEIVTSGEQMVSIALALRDEGWDARKVRHATRRLLKDPDFRERVRYTKVVTGSDFLDAGPPKTTLSEIDSAEQVASADG